MKEEQKMIALDEYEEGAVIEPARSRPRLIEMRRQVVAQDDVLCMA